MVDVEQLKAQYPGTVERVWELTYEKNENEDIYKGAELRLDGDGALATPVLINSGRKLYNAHLDRTTPNGQFNYFVVTEIHTSEGLVTGIKVAAAEVPEPQQDASPLVGRTHNQDLTLIGITAFAGGLLLGWLMKD
jgi:hypothetical protein